MGDTNNLTLVVPDPPKGLREAIADAFFEYAAFSETYAQRGTENVDEGDLMIGANEVSQGAVDNLSVDLDTIISDGIDIKCPVCDGWGEKDDVTCKRCDGAGEVKTEPQDFAYLVHDDPKYEYLGSITMHVPGLPDFVGMCDSDGNVIADTDSLLVLVNEATDLDALKAEVATLTGSAHTNVLHPRPAQEATA